MTEGCGSEGVSEGECESLLKIYTPPSLLLLLLVTGLSEGKSEGE